CTDSIKPECRCKAYYAASHAPARIRAEWSSKPGIGVRVAITIDSAPFVVATPTVCSPGCPGSAKGPQIDDICNLPMPVPNGMRPMFVNRSSRAMHRVNFSAAASHSLASNTFFKAPVWSARFCNETGTVSPRLMNRARFQNPDVVCGSNEAIVEVM